MLRRSLLLSLVVAATGCGFVVQLAPSSPGAPPRSTATRALFDFHSNPWVSLHHVLYREGLKRRGDTSLDKHGFESLDALALEGERARAWDAAVGYYARAISARDLTFDDELADANQELSRLESSPDLAGAKLPPELREALVTTMPTYRAKLWPEHDRKNHQWIDSMTPLVDRHGAEIAKELSGWYRIEWPSEPLRVDVTAYASWSGAYTTLHPTHLTVSGIDERNQGAAGLEILFHESSHALIFPVKEALAKALASQKKEAKSLWHVLLFFTTGYAVEKRTPGYVPYAKKLGLYKGEWLANARAVERGFLPYLQGKTTFDASIRETVSALP